MRSFEVSDKLLGVVGFCKQNAISPSLWAESWNIAKNDSIN
jgi:hypothetical protein